MGSDRRRSALRRWAVVFALVCLAAPASSAPTRAERNTARRLMDEGKAQTEQGNLEGALEAYAKAHEIMHVPTTGLAVATTHFALGHLLEAREVALEVVQSRREEGEASVFDKARERAKELESRIAARLPSIRVVVRGGAAASATIDGVEIPVAKLAERIPLNPGARSVAVRDAKGVEAKSEFVIAEKESRDVVLTLPAPPPAEASPPPKTVTWDESEAPSETRTPLSNVLMIGGFGLGAVSAAYGSVAGILAAGKADDVKPFCESNVCGPEAKNELDGARLMATLSTIGFVVAGAGLALGVVGLVLPKRPARATALELTPGGFRGAF